MPKTHKSKPIRVSIFPAESPQNSFVTRFAQTLASCGYDVAGFSWYPTKLFRTDVAILHWPDYFFAPGAGISTGKALVRLALLKLVKLFKHTQFIWVAHNLRPHDTSGKSSSITDSFLQSLDGIIYLSNYSKEATHALYPTTESKPGLVTVHGHYRDDFQTPSTPAPPIHDRVIKLAFVGLVRPYKNTELLAECVSKMGDSVTLNISGACRDDALTARLSSLAQSNSNIQLDLRRDILPDADLEAAIDNSHAAVLPYRNILNSGSAILSLSRNRPVLAPKMGSFPELQASVGANWLYLYDGEISVDILDQFAEWMRVRNAPASADLSAYDWNKIGKALSGFIDSLTIGS